jgi:hypothetical protein
MIFSFFLKLDDNSDFFFRAILESLAHLACGNIILYKRINLVHKFSNMKRKKKDLSKKMIIDLSEICFGSNK